MAEERLLEGAAYVRKIHGFKIFVDESMRVNLNYYNLNAL